MIIKSNKVNYLLICEQAKKMESQKNKHRFSLKPLVLGRFEQSKLGFELLMFYYVYLRSIFLKPRFN